MKNTDWKIFIATLAYTYLFYQQEPGLNYLVFAILMVILALLQNTENVKKPQWLAVAAGAIISGFFVFYYGTNLPVVANTISLIFLAGITFKANTSLLLSGLNTLSSYVFAIPLLFINFFKSKFRKNDTEALPAEKPSKTIFKKMLLLLFPLFVVFVFFVLYRGSNPLFMKITEDINLDWLSFPLVKFLLSALLMMYAFFVQNIIKPFNDIDERLQDDIDFVDEEIHEKSFFSKFLTLESEIFTATSLLVMLNLLIAFLNAIDINYLWLKADLPQGLVFSDYLHSGTFTLIISIVFAILVIIFFFRGIFNFNAKGKWLKVLGFLWVLQNIVMIISAMLRNQLYIADYGMTHKRIGVYVFLVLAVVGLVVTIVKIALKKNTLFLLRKNAWAFYAVLIIATAFNWDMIITKHNIKLANNKYVVDLDKNYLARLSHVNTYALALQDSAKTPFEIYFGSNGDAWDKSDLQIKLQKLLDYENRNNWQEICLNKNENIAKLKELNNMGKIAKLDLYSLYIEDITAYETLSNIKGIDLKNNYLNDHLNGLETYPKLEVVNLVNNNIRKLDSMPNLENLTHLNLSNNSVKDYGILEESAANLTHLNLSQSQELLEEESFPTLPKLESINLSETKLESWNFLANQENLKEIIFQRNKSYEVQVPKLEKLERLDLTSSNMLYYDDVPFLDSLADCKNLKELILTNCRIGSTVYLLNTRRNKALFPNVEILNLYGNALDNDILALRFYKNLKELILSSNIITDIDGLKNVKGLEALYLNINSIRNLKPLSKMENLKTLNLNGNEIDIVDDLLSIQTLEDLNLGNNKIRNIDSLIVLENLTSLNISNNKIKDISQLVGMSNLTHLSIANNPIKDYKVLHKMSQLKYLSVGNIDLDIIEALKKALPTTEIDYYSNNLNKAINYNNNKRSSYSEKF